jgi:alanine-alpha-ketoisovalerate/valine-pyruvate aminotransferase
MLHGKDIKVLHGEYKYHERLNPDIIPMNWQDLSKGDVLILSMPFPRTGDVHSEMQQILNHCAKQSVPVHIDGAWVSCCYGIAFDFSHPAIKSFAVSLSKGGMGGNRIGVRYSREWVNDSISIMNDFNMNSQALVSLGKKFIETFGPEYLWKKYGEAYSRVCSDFGLEPTRAIHLALDSTGSPVGVRPLLRCLV